MVKKKSNLNTKKITSFRVYPSLQKVGLWGGMLTIILTIFGGGYKMGCYISDIKCSENNIKIIGDFQKERESLKETIEEYRFNNVNYVTKEEFEQLRKSFDKFYKEKK